MIPYLTLPFAFTTESFDWLNSFLDPLVTEYQTSAPAISALVNFTPKQLDEITNSKMWEEVVQFTTQCGLNNPHPQLFIYKSLPKPRRTTLGNPHIDTYGPTGTDKLVPIRFNIMLRGEDTSEMVWWNRERDNPDVVRSEFVRPDWTPIGRLQAKGVTLEEQWQIVGEPDFRATHLARVQEYASFVRTDILHALNWTGNQPRLIFSVKFNEQSWENVEQLRSKS